jgi:single-strand DNA-binding protein
MANLNKVMLMGNLTRDPEVKYTPKGTAVAELGMAINRVYMVEGQKKEEVTFVDVTLWGRTAEVAGEFLKKGNPCFIEGRLSLDQWEDKTTGQKRSKLKVVGDHLQLMGGKREGGEGGGGAPRQPSSQQRPAQQQRPAAPKNPDTQPEEDDIPF